MYGWPEYFDHYCYCVLLYLFCPVMGTNSKFAAGAGPLIQNSAGADQQAQQWMIPCSLSVNTARRLSKPILTKLCFFNYNRVSLACTRNIEKILVYWHKCEIKCWPFAGAGRLPKIPLVLRWRVIKFRWRWSFITRYPLALAQTLTKRTSGAAQFWFCLFRFIMFYSEFPL